jgi:hypothetical protein
MTSAWRTKRSIIADDDDVVAEHLATAAEDLVAGHDQAGRSYRDETNWTNRFAASTMRHG